MPRRTKIESIERTIELVEAGDLIAHPLFLQAPFSELLEICNGCGAAGAKFDFVPDTIWGLWVGPTCNLHDFDYHMGRTDQDKAEADIRMLANNLRTIEACSTWILKPPRRMRALNYYQAVTDFGGPAFWSGKEKTL